MLQVSNLTKKVSGKKILDNLGFEIKRGEIAIFLGESGVGKSSLLRVLNNLEDYSCGEFTFDGNLLPLSSVNRNHIIGMVFQHFNLFEHLTCEENITLALVKSKKMDKAEALGVANRFLARYELGDKAKSPMRTLSGGQKQRLAIARTLALNPEIICLDEPTSALDPRLSSQVATFITEIASDNRIVLLSTHDTNLPNLLKQHSTLFLMKSGMIVQKAHASDFYNNPGEFPLLERFLCGASGG
jgi:glutamine transport system ATP-binding protein